MFIHSHVASGEAQTLAPIAKFELSEGWARNTVNTAIYRGAGLVTAFGIQFGAYYRSPQEIILFKRVLENRNIEFHCLQVNTQIKDAHNVISLGVDGEGYLHLCYDHHNTPLVYRRSTKPLVINSWSDKLQMTGVGEEHVSYPYFVSPSRENEPLLFFFRSGGASKGDLYVKSYNAISKLWIDLETPVLAGANQRPWTCGPYMHHPAADHMGRIHLFFTWRTQLHAADGPVDNHNIDYACTPDSGRTWVSSGDVHFLLPITPVTSETALGTAPSCNLINQCGAAANSQGHPFAVFYINDDSGTPQYCLLWNDGHKWRRQWLSSQQNRFELRGRGTLRLPLSRPDIVIDRNDVVWIVFRAHFSGDRMAALPLHGPDYEPDYSTAQILWNVDLKHCEPVIDRSRFARDNVLSMLLQSTDQVDGEGLSDANVSPVYIADWVLKDQRRRLPISRRIADFLMGLTNIRQGR